MQKSHGNIEGGSSPVFQRKEVFVCLLDNGGGHQHISGSHSGHKQRLVGISHSSISEKNLLFLYNGIGQGFGALFFVNISPSSQLLIPLFFRNLRWQGTVECGLEGSSLDSGRLVNGEFGKPLENFGLFVLLGFEIEEFRVRGNEGCVEVSFSKNLVIQNVE